MTKIAFSLFIGLTCLFASSSNLSAQKQFEGKLTYTIEYIKIPDEMKGMESMLPSGMVTYIKGSKSRTEQESGMGGQNIIIHDSEKEETMVLMDLLGQKMAIVPSAEEQKEAKVEMDKMEVELVDESKTVAGYACKKALISSPEMDFPMAVYYTEELQNNSVDFAKIPGMPLEYVTELQGMKMKVVATSVEKNKVGGNLFEIPSDYEKLTGEELQKKFGALGQ